MIKILFIDDELSSHEILRKLLPPEFSLISATHGIIGCALFNSEAPEVVLLDHSLPDIDGIDVLKRITSIPSAPPVIMLTGNSDTRLIVKAMRIGAYDYLIKPYELKQLLLSIKKALLYSLPGKRPENVKENPLEKLAGESPAIRKIKHLMTKFADSSSPILITGESGTGKGLIAEIIHTLSPRSKGPFLIKNCGAIPDTLIESELFGAEKGAFTDATLRAGSFEQAEGGTLLLDEIGEMNPASQVRLLNVLESKQITRLGGSRQIPVDVRFISATNKNLKKAVKERAFREDLFYRINTLMLHVSPLKERTEDIPYIVSRFLSTFYQDGRHLHPLALEKLLAYPWPGNVRELKNVLDRSVVMADTDTIFAKDILFYNSRM